MEAIRAIKAPTLLIIGDSDVVRPEHTVELFHLLGGGVAGDLFGLPLSQLAVPPGTTHVTLVDRTEWLVSMIMQFLCDTAHCVRKISTERQPTFMESRAPITLLLSTLRLWFLLRRP